MASTTDHVPARDGVPTLVRHWPTAHGDAWASVLLVHGIAEHSGRYEHVGEALSAIGLEVTGYDLRGFGGSAGRRAYVDRWSEFHDDLEDRLADVRERSRGRLVAIYAHSMGGLIALGYVLAGRPTPDALILSAPAIDVTLPAWRRGLLTGLARVAPRLSVANGLDGEVLSRDPEVGARYLADPLAWHRTTTRLASLGLSEQVRVRAAVPALTTPTLVIHGGDDRLVPTRTSEVLGELENVERRVYPGLRHELHNEPEGSAVLADVVGWLRARATIGAQLKTASGERIAR